VLDIDRGAVHAHADGYFEVILGSGTVRVPVPRYRMPDVPKLSAGYFAAPGWISSISSSAPRGPWASIVT